MWLCFVSATNCHTLALSVHPEQQLKRYVAEFLSTHTLGMIRVAYTVHYYVIITRSCVDQLMNLIVSMYVDQLMNLIVSMFLATVQQCNVVSITNLSLHKAPLLYLSSTCKLFYVIS